MRGIAGKVLLKTFTFRHEIVHQDKNVKLRSKKISKTQNFFTSRIKGAQRAYNPTKSYQDISEAYWLVLDKNAFNSCQID